MRITLFVALLSLVACVEPAPTDPTRPPAPPFSGDVDASCSSACTNLRRLGCPEGSGAISGETCERRCVVAMELRAMPIDCWTAAEDVPSAKACGSLRCLR